MRKVKTKKTFENGQDACKMTASFDVFMEIVRDSESCMTARLSTRHLANALFARCFRHILFLNQRRKLEFEWKLNIFHPFHDLFAE